MIRPALMIAVALLFLPFVSPPSASGAATPNWVKVRSRNFLLVGNADEREIRQVASKLEQFRELFRQLSLTGPSFDAGVPTIVVIFRDDMSYRPFEPLYQGRPSEVAGYFQSGPDVNYITLSADPEHARGPSALAFHEYVHLLLKSSLGRAPLWLNEGLAEFYSSIELTDGARQVKLGRAIKGRTQALRQQTLLPLSMLFRIDDASPFYNEAGRRKIFYAESWALVHYLLNGPITERREQFLRYLSGLAAGQTEAEAFHQSFGSDLTALESEFGRYVERARYTERPLVLERPLSFEQTMQSEPLTPAESSLYQGDLLLHSGRFDEAEPYLQDALNLDDGLAAAHLAFGMLRLRQNRFREAVGSLSRAVALDAGNYLAHYYYADALSREGAGSEQLADGYYDVETVRVMRAELKTAIELAPQFVEPYRLLAFIDLVANEQLEEAGPLLERAMRLAPHRRELTLLLAQVQLRREQFQSARSLLSMLLQRSDATHLHPQAQSLLELVAAREELSSRLKAAAAQAATNERASGELQPCDAPQPGPQVKRLRFSGQQACGQLLKVECEEGSVVLVIEAGDRTLKLRSQALNRIRFVTYTSDIRGQMTCGLRQPATPVLVTYRSMRDEQSQVDGEVLAVEFIPKDWNPPAPPAAP